MRHNNIIVTFELHMYLSKSTIRHNSYFSFILYLIKNNVFYYALFSSHLFLTITPTGDDIRVWVLEM